MSEPIDTSTTIPETLVISRMSALLEELTSQCSQPPGLSSKWLARGKDESEPGPKSLDGSDDKEISAEMSESSQRDPIAVEEVTEVGDDNVNAGLISDTNDFLSKLEEVKNLWFAGAYNRMTDVDDQVSSADEFIQKIGWRHPLFNAYEGARQSGSTPTLNDFITGTCPQKGLRPVYTYDRRSGGSIFRPCIVFPDGEIESADHLRSVIEGTASNAVRQWVESALKTHGSLSFG
ncbi:hypothetical protein BD324DRAFT_627686 [Kockovaella imperatae]|uniref:Uncharacterized protein n=1 Tax=Kockovaella imperatae TaxID=4999 RepID=A0A1Y1UHE7_9TREE|nr:hypothetical protein BD324DRAFT_627686 [Kockovaella imperatae]ORX36916.1 hypothetical protein BD324DRAFT_627686 [Kockovaella imperatae]